MWATKIGYISFFHQHCNSKVPPGQSVSNGLINCLVTLSGTVQVIDEVAGSCAESEVMERCDLNAIFGRAYAANELMLVCT